MRTGLAGKRALVTGATGGLGHAIARRLAAEGASVVLSGRRPDALRTLAAETGGEVLACDLAARDELRPLLDAARDTDILVCNAALPATGTVDDFSIEEIDRALDVNLRAPILLARAAGTAMAGRGGGHIVFVSSMAAKTAGPALGLYAATKAGLRALGLSLREDLRPVGVGVSVIYPGPISEAGMWAEADLEPPLGIRMKPPAAVAQAVVDAIVHNPAEIHVASPMLRAAAAFAQLRPEWFATMGRRQAGAYAAKMTAAGRAKR